MASVAFSEKFAQSNSLRRKVALRTWVWELLVTSLVLCFLVTLAEPLSEGGRPLGLGQRYAASATAAKSASSNNTKFSDFARSNFTYFDIAPTNMDKPARAQWLNRHVGTVLILLTTCGWIALGIGRGITRVGMRRSLIAALWCTAASLLGIFSARWQLPAVPGQVNQMWHLADLWLPCACALCISALWSGLRLAGAPPPRLQFEHAAASPWVYPGFVLFSGLGWLWLLDWAARGHADKQFVGIYQIDSLWLAFAVFTLVAAHHGQLLAAMCRFASRLDARAAKWSIPPNVPLLCGVVAWIGLMVAVGHLDTGDTGQLKVYQRHSALLAELMRVPTWLAMGWISYRWVETGQRTAKGLLAIALLLLALVSGLKFDHDGGPVFAQTIAVTWIVCGLMLPVLSRRFGRIAGWASTVAMAGLGTAGAVCMAFLYAPVLRIKAMAIDYEGPLDFLSVTHWLFDAIPASGFGLGKTPWCGYAQAVGLLGQCRRAGVPDQIQSDYVVPALLALWGWLPTLALVAALLLWLWELQRIGPARSSEALNFSLLRQWLVTGFAVTSGVQIAINAAGALGAIPFTGLAIPMLSLGVAGLLSTALFAGLSVNRVRIKQRRTTP